MGEEGRVTTSHLAVTVVIKTKQTKLRRWRLPTQQTKLRRRFQAQRRRQARLRRRRQGSRRLHHNHNPSQANDETVQPPRILPNIKVHPTSRSRHLQETFTRTRHIEEIRTTCSSSPTHDVEEIRTTRCCPLKARGTINSLHNHDRNAQATSRPSRNPKDTLRLRRDTRAFQTSASLPSSSCTSSIHTQARTRACARTSYHTTRSCTTS